MKKTIIVTGVTGGIGSQIARKFILMGDIVIGVYNNSESVAMQLKKEFGANLHLYKCDLSDFDCGEKLLLYIEETKNVRKPWKYVVFRLYWKKYKKIKKRLALLPWIRYTKRAVTW